MSKKTKKIRDSKLLEICKNSAGIQFKEEKYFDKANRVPTVACITAVIIGLLGLVFCWSFPIGFPVKIVMAVMFAFAFFVGMNSLCCK